MRANDGFSSLAHGLISILHKYALFFRFSFLFSLSFFFGGGEEGWRGGAAVGYSMCDTIYAVYPQNELNEIIYFCKLYATALLLFCLFMPEFDHP